MIFTHYYLEHFLDANNCNINTTTLYVDEPLKQSGVPELQGAISMYETPNKKPMTEILSVSLVDALLNGVEVE